MGSKQKRRAKEIEISKRKRGNKLMAISAGVIIIAGAIIFFAVSGFGDSTPETAQALTPSPTPAPTKSITVTPTPTPEPSPSPSPSPTPTPTPEPKPSGAIKAVWIDPQVAGETVTIPVSEVENNVNIHFKLGAGADTMNFMAYALDGETYVRANVCPPCRSIGFSLNKNILVCDKCRTTFDGETGTGIDGACVNFPKASVQYEIAEGNLVMSKADLTAA
ncbi:Fe-S-containing protein, partial [Chloroflexota bacterium]